MTPLLPTHIIIHISEYLPIGSRSRLSMINKEINQSLAKEKCTTCNNDVASTLYNDTFYECGKCFLIAAFSWGSISVRADAINERKKKKKEKEEDEKKKNNFIKEEEEEEEEKMKKQRLQQNEDCTAMVEVDFKRKRNGEGGKHVVKERIEKLLAKYIPTIQRNLDPLGTLSAKYSETEKGSEKKAWSVDAEILIELVWSLKDNFEATKEFKESLFFEIVVSFQEGIVGNYNAQGYGYFIDEECDPSGEHEKDDKNEIIKSSYVLNVMFDFDN